jgi:hypothetical protein
MSLINKLSCFLVVALLQHNAVVFAQQLNISKSEMRKNGSGFSDDAAIYNSSSLSQSSAEEFGLSALALKTTNDEPNNGVVKIEQLFLLDSISELQNHKHLHFQTGLYSLKNNYILTPNYTTLLSNQRLMTSAVENELYQLGRFSAETGYSRTTALNEKNFKAYIHSAYSLVHKGRFDLSLTASLQRINTSQTKYDFAPALPPLLNTANSANATSTTFGVIGSFDLTKRWSLISALTVSHLNYQYRHDGPLRENKRNMALIGTTYAF